METDPSRIPHLSSPAHRPGEDPAGALFDVSGKIIAKGRVSMYPMPTPTHLSFVVIGGTLKGVDPASAVEIQVFDADERLKLADGRQAPDLSSGSRYIFKIAKAEC